MEPTDALIDTQDREMELVAVRPTMAAPSAMTPAQARVDAVAALTSVALSKAATLQLTPEETERLTAEFPDADFLPGAAGKENLIYIQHSALRGRLNSVLGLGQWALVVRESWNEDFETRGSAGKPPQKGVRVYVRAMMLVRGCYVAEAVGDMDYYPGNAAQNYGDAFEGSKTAAFRRCAKEFGVGVQAWDRHWCDSWWARKRGAPRQNAQQAPAVSAANVPKPPEAPKTPPAPKTAAALTPEERKAALIAKCRGMELEATQVMKEEGILLPTEGLGDISLTTIDLMSPDNMLALVKQIRQRKWDNDQLPGAEVSQPEQPLGVEGTLEDTNAKAGTGKNGKPFTKFGIKIDGVWHNTFSRGLFETAMKLKGQRVLYTAQTGQFGSDLMTIEAAAEVIP